MHSTSHSRRLAQLPPRPRSRFICGVGWAMVCGWQVCGALLHAEEQLPLKKLDGATRAKVFATLTGLVILGLFLVLFAVWGANFTRRYMRSGKSFGPTTLPGDDDWTSQPIVPPAGSGRPSQEEG